MAFNSQPPRVEYTSTVGQTVFTFLFKIYSETDIVVYQTLEGVAPDDTADILEITTDYTVVIDGDNGGTVTLVTPTTGEDAVTLLRVLPQVRDFEYQTGGDLLAATLNDDQDYQAYLIADGQSSNERVMTLSQNSQNVSNVMPAVESQQFLRWKQDGSGLENAAAVVQEITEFNDTDFRIVSTSNKKLQYSLTALTALRTWTVPDKDIDFGEFYTKTESDAITDLKIDTSAIAQTKLGDLTIGETVVVSSWSFDTTTITINTSAIHNLIVGQYFSVGGLVATTNAPNGRWQVATVVDTDTITFTAVDTPTGTPTVSSALLNHGDIEFYGATLGKNACTAWVNFDGTATPPTIKDSFNVNDVVRTATGVFEIYFEEAMGNANYAVTDSVNRPVNPTICHTDLFTTTKFTAYVTNAAGTAVDASSVNFEIKGGK